MTPRFWWHWSTDSYGDEVSESALEAADDDISGWAFKTIDQQGYEALADFEQGGFRILIVKDDEADIGCWMWRA